MKVGKWDGLGGGGEQSGGGRRGPRLMERRTATLKQCIALSNRILKTNLHEVLLMILEVEKEISR